MEHLNGAFDSGSLDCRGWHLNILLNTEEHASRSDYTSLLQQLPQTTIHSTPKCPPVLQNQPARKLWKEQMPLQEPTCKELWKGQNAKLGTSTSCVR